jgi:hypothetical protein
MSLSFIILAFICTSLCIYTYIMSYIYIHTCVTWEIMPSSMTWWEHATERWWWVPWTVCCCRMHWGISAYCSYQLLANSNVIIVHYQITSNTIWWYQCYIYILDIILYCILMSPSPWDGYLTAGGGSASAGTLEVQVGNIIHAVSCEARFAPEVFWLVFAHLKSLLWMCDLFFARTSEPNVQN